jgi:hypothetical protein
LVREPGVVDREGSAAGQLLGQDKVGRRLAAATSREAERQHANPTLTRNQRHPRQRADTQITHEREVLRARRSCLHPGVGDLDRELCLAPSCCAHNVRRGAERDVRGTGDRVVEVCPYAPEGPPVLVPREGPPACSSADVLTVLERMQSARYPGAGHGKGRRIRAAARFHRNKELIAASTSCWST